jgi:exodeoxyribonuclease VII small subunit
VAEKTEDFETLLKRLEEIVGKMDGGGLSLEDSMKLYEEGVQNSDRLTAMLAESRNRVMKLVADRNGNDALEPFESGDER